MANDEQWGWYFVDLENTRQGPYDSTMMQAWYYEGYLQPTVPLSSNARGPYVTLGQWIAEYGGCPFDEEILEKIMGGGGGDGAGPVSPQSGETGEKSWTGEVEDGVGQGGEEDGGDGDGGEGYGSTPPQCLVPNALCLTAHSFTVLQRSPAPSHSNAPLAPLQRSTPSLHSPRSLGKGMATRTGAARSTTMKRRQPMSSRRPSKCIAHRSPCHPCAQHAAPTFMYYSAAQRQLDPHHFVHTRYSPPHHGTRSLTRGKRSLGSPKRRSPVTPPSPLAGSLHSFAPLVSLHSFRATRFAPRNRPTHHYSARPSHSPHSFCRATPLLPHSRFQMALH